MAQKGYSVKYKKEGQTSGSATTSYSAKDESEVCRKFAKDHPGCKIIEIKQTW